jgi:hypothetical protein
MRQREVQLKQDIARLQKDMAMIHASRANVANVGDYYYLFMIIVVVIIGELTECSE